MIANVDEIPVIGQVYQRAGIVTAIDEKVQETPGKKIWTRQIITLDSGAIYTLDQYVPKPKEDEEKQQVSRGSLSAQQTETTRPAEQEEEDDDDDEESSVPLTILVYSKNDPNLPAPGSSSSQQPEPIRGIWTFGDGRSVYDDDNNDDEDDDDMFWKPQEVVLFPPKRKLETIPEEGEDDLPTGVWGYAEDQEPNSSFSSLRPGSIDGAEDWYPRGHALVVPPTVEVPENFVAAGRYTYKPGSTHKTWPPAIDHVKKQLHGVGKLNVPKCFKENDGKLPIKVFPKSKVPDPPPRSSTDRWAESKGAAPVDLSPPKPRKKAVTFAPPVGQWAYPDGEEVEDDHFLPVDVDLYWGDEKPPSVSGPMSDDGSLVSWGVWGSSVGSVDLDDPEWEPEMSMVFPPGIEPDPEIAIQGRWAYRMNQNVKIEWPPTVTRTATVYPSKDAPAVERGKSQGVWEFRDGRNQANEDDWEAFEVDLLGEYENVDGDDDDDEPRPFGFWGIRHGAEPDRNWDWEPKDVVFFPPGEEPGEDTWVQGKWAIKRKVGKLKDTWPPKSQSKPKSRSVGKLKPLQWPSTAWVYPTQIAPSPSPGRTLGVWKFSGGSEPVDASSWTPQQVDLYGASDKVDDTKPNGTWGVNADAEALNDADDSFFAPEDIWFYPPGEVPDKNCSVQGKWAFQKSKLDITWPPPIQSAAQPARMSSVGKLKIPGAFEKEASPRVGGKKVLSGKAQLPSMFSNS